MYDKIKSLLKTSTFRQSSITAISTFGSAGLGAVFYLIVARVLGTSEYGLFSLSLTILVTLVTVADVGMGQGIVRFIGEHRDSQKYLAYANFALRTKIVTAVISWIGLALFARQIAFIFGQPSLEGLLPYVGFGTFSFILATYSFSVLQSLQKFVIWGSLQVGSNLLRLLVLWVVSRLMPVDATLAILVFALTLFVSFILSWLWLDKRIITANSDRTHATQFWNFNKWTASFSMLSSVVARLDVFFTGRYLDLSTVGTYSLAVTMVSFLPQLAVAIGAVTSAKLANKSDKKDAEVYLKKSTIFSSLTSIGVSALMIPIALLVVNYVGPDYTDSIMPFFILLVAQMIFMFGNPLRDYMLYFLRKPQVFFWVGLIQGGIITLSCVLLIPLYGVFGSALSVLIGQVVLGLLCLIYFKSKK